MKKTNPLIFSAIALSFAISAFADFAQKGVENSSLLKKNNEKILGRIVGEYNVMPGSDPMCYGNRIGNSMFSITLDHDSDGESSAIGTGIDICVLISLPSEFSHQYTCGIDQDLDFNDDFGNLALSRSIVNHQGLIDFSFGENNDTYIKEISKDNLMVKMLLGFKKFLGVDTDQNPYFGKCRLKRR